MSDETTSSRNQTILRLAIISITTAAVIVASIYFIRAVSGCGVHWLEIAAVPFFALLFGWITFSFCLASLGFLQLLTSKRQVQEKAPVRSSSRTAVLMPVYNESPRRVFAGLGAMAKCLRQQGVAEQFDFFVLSDTTNPEVWLSEEVAWHRLTSEQLDEHDVDVFYRHRAENTSRKAGNIADFCTRWGSQYPYMIVLDADSLMSAETMIAMVAQMDADPKIGILQVPPVPIGRQSLFAKLQQFAASAYGALFVRGFAAWAGSQGNYWGHNAIIRIEPFLEHCELPKLPGEAPLGGEVLSHDFVEAALMVRAGFKVEIATDLSGSYEECPTTLTDYAQRDQRWCQGNLQHTRLMINETINPLSRLHFASGILAYAASPLWLVMTTLCVAALVFEECFPGDAAGGSSEPSTRAALALFGISMAMLLLPKFMSLTALSIDSRLRVQYGGMLRLWISGLVEIVTSILLSPIMAVYHSRFVISTLAGTNVRWSAQQRDERGVAWTEAMLDFGGMMVLGTVIMTLIYFFQPTLLVWFAPFLVGLVLAVPIAVAMGSGTLGQMLTKLDLLSIPEDREQPEVAKFQQQALESENASPFAEFRSLLDAVIRDPTLFLLHREIQSRNGCNVPLATSQSKAIEAAWAARGTEGIPDKLVAPLLNDASTLEALHIEAQLSTTV